MQKLSCLLKFFFYFSLSIATIHSYARQLSANRQLNEFNLFEENGKVGLKDSSGKVIIAAQYEALGWSNGKFSIVNNVTGYKLHGLWGLISTENKRVTKAEFQDLSPGEGLILVARKKISHSVKIQAGCINTSGKVVVPFQYDGLSMASFRAIVYMKSSSRFTHGLIDLENKLLIPINFQSIYPLGSLRYGVQNFESKTAIFSEEGKQLTPFLIDSLSTFKKNLAVIYQNNRQGLIDREGEIRLEAVYREVKIQDDGSVLVRQADSWLFLDGENKLLRQFNADSITAINNHFYKIQNGSQVYIGNRELKPIDQQYFSRIGNFFAGKAIVERANRLGVVRENGSLAIAPAYESLVIDGRFIRATQKIENRTRYILLDTAGKTVSKKHYEFIGNFNGEFFPVKNKTYWGAMDAGGNEIVACVHDSIVQNTKDYIIVKFKGNYGIINMHEDWIVTPQPNRLLLLNNDRYIEYAGKTLILKSFPKNIIYFTENPVELKSDHLREYLPSGSIWKIDLNGVIADRFAQLESVEKVFPEQEGLRAIKKDGRYGFVDSRNRLRIANRYEDVKSFSEGLAAARILGRWGFINKEDKIAIQPVYDEVYSFSNGYALVTQKGQFGLIDKNGKVVLPVRYNDIKLLESKRLLINQNGLFGLADRNGKVLIGTKYNNITDLQNGYVIVQRDGKFGLISLEGLSTIPLIYDELSYDSIHNEYLALKKAGWEQAKIQ